MSSIQFGSIPSMIVSFHAGGEVRSTVTVPPEYVSSVSTKHSMYASAGARLCEQYDAKVKGCFAAIDSGSYTKPTMHARAKSLKNGFKTLVEPPEHKLKKLLLKEKRKLEEHHAFMHGGDSIITGISIGGGPKASSLCEQRKAPVALNKTPSRKVKVVHAQVKMTSAQMDNFIRSLVKHMKQPMGIEFIGKRRTQCALTRGKNGAKEIRVKLKHHEGKRDVRDIRIDEPTRNFLKLISKKCVGKRVFNAQDLTYGDSGLVIPVENLRGRYNTALFGMLIVRGSCDGRIYDARSKLNADVRWRIRQFSDPGSKFWDGFNRKLQEFKPHQFDHICESNFDVTRCGEVAAIVSQILFPNGKITCKQCAQNYSDKSRDEIKEVVTSGIRQKGELIRENYQEFVNVISFLREYGDMSNARNTNFEAFGDIQKMIGDRNDAPFSHISKINEVLIKGNGATPEELYHATDHLREVARWLKNRTENIRAGDLRSFRNKVSAKAYMNAALLCDNQLDASGNFLWRERGRHSKRFFKDYFEHVDSTNGYEKHQIRVNPNGSRKLAIGKLIISTNFESFRRGMKGEAIEDPGLTEACVSRKNENFVYPCSCVTLDDGRPLVSDMKTPTKHHLVVGNSGEPKYVDLPQLEDNKMYIAKDGYCYINIFLAMLVNVSDEKAKEFTKTTRDILISKLGKWPSMMDVATACYTLAVLFPETRSAELPRIMVDHVSKIMHVIDSYGSATTGYHILKANTVNQLIQFADDDLNSELKHYLVGGKSHAPDLELKSISLILKCLYKPKLMRDLIIEDPYILVISILSPTVMIAMHENRTFEEALSIWLSKDRSIAEVAMVLSHLAKKVSITDVLVEQKRIIDGEIPTLLNAAFAGFKTFSSYALAIQLLQKKAANNESNEKLLESGYYNFSDESFKLMEKKFSEELEAEWQGCTFLEKCCAMKSSRKYRECTISNFTQRSREALKGKWTCYTTTSPKTAMCTLKNGVSSGIQKGRDMVTRSARKICCKTVGMVTYLFPDIFKFINTLIIVSVVLQIASVCSSMYKESIKHKIQLNTLKRQEEEIAIVNAYNRFVLKKGDKPTIEEFTEYLAQKDKSLWESFTAHAVEFDVIHQAKRPSEEKLERIIAFFSLVLMMFDSDRSDCVYKILMKLRNLVQITEGSVHHQSLDDIQDHIEEKKLTVDFDLSTESIVKQTPSEMTFAQWWEHQLEYNRIVPHYRTEGHFMEFTRATCVKVANEIASGSEKDILLRGAVGSGKSTGLPFHLSKKGKVLLLEPTRPLAENVAKQLRAEPFLSKPTLRMRNLSSFGSSPISIMTSGFALQHFGHNPQQLHDFDYIIIDECHVNDENAMAFRCLCIDHDHKGKTIKVSATPPGREVAFTTQFPVNIVVEEQLSLSSFVTGLNTGCAADACKYGNNTLVYVASYNEVDNLAKMLVEKGHRVTKVDGRTMKVGNIEIRTVGTSERHHFVVATNIIENGVTLDIDTVVDFGVKVIPKLDADNRIINYSKVSISYGERIQRLGRVGRHKEGTAIRIGHTEKALVEIPEITAIAAAFKCFQFGLPVMTSNVSVSLLGNCTVPQARTMQQFELPLYFMMDLVKFDGSMHPAVYNLLKPYKLNESQTHLNTTAIPDRCVGRWLTAGQYTRLGCSNNLPVEKRVCFMARDIPDSLHEKLFDVICQYKGDAGFGRLSMTSAARVAYTLQTDIHSIARTLKIIEILLEEEQKKKAYMDAASYSSCSVGSLSLAGIHNLIKSRYAQDHTTENISKLQAVKAQLSEFKNLSIDPNAHELLRDFGALECVHHQSADDISKYLKLKGKWNKPLVVKDIFILIGVLVGGIMMVFSTFKDKMSEEVVHQGKGKRQAQKLRFRAARDNKHAYEVHGPDETIEHFFGSAYTAKGKQKGNHRGMGIKTRKFINMYGFDPTQYSTVRFVDPLTGATLDDNPITDIGLIQEHFGIIRDELIKSGELEPERVRNIPGIEAYYMNKAAKSALKIDLTPHNPLRVGSKSNSIAGFPERELELRQDGKHQVIDVSQVPQKNELVDVVSEEGKSLMGGLRDYNPISSVVCKLTNDSDGHKKTLHGIGYGSLIITNRHLFTRNNGTLSVTSHHGEFIVKNTTSLKLLPIKDRDILIIQMPKDFPPFPMRLQFREPIQNEVVCMVGNNFHNKHISSMVSESSLITKVPNSHFWAHWVSTKDGQCGIPFISVKDTCVLGLHCLANNTCTKNYFVQFPEGFKETYLDNTQHLKWVEKWKYNPNEIAWGPLKLQQDQYEPAFKIAKLITDLTSEQVHAQGFDEGWMYNELNGNLKAIARTTGNLVTKHVVKGRCPLFQAYLQTDEDAEKFFRPLMGFYDKSRLNKEAYIKDIMKYSTPIMIGQVDCTEFEASVTETILMMEAIGFKTCNFVTDTEDIFSSLNMKSAVGALYVGKKKDYFENFTDADKDEIIFESCKRLFCGKMGVWNGSLKAEIRPIEKVLANKTRTFTAAPLDTLLAGKVCVDDFNNQFYTLNLKGPWSVGMTKFRGGWDQLLRSFPADWVYCDADGSQFDSSLSPYLINAVLQIRMHFMENWDVGMQMLSNLYTEIIYTPIATPDGTIVKKFKGNNSGQPSTVVDNTLMVILAMKYSLKRLGIDYHHQDEYCKFVVNGDDLIIALHPSKAYVLDGMNKEFADLGLNYDFSSRTQNLGDLWFMSHCGMERDGLFIPKLEPERVVSILEWDRASEPEHRLEAICASMIEAWGYDELLHEIRKFYKWVLEQAPYNILANEGKAPYIAEVALQHLYTGTDVGTSELFEYYKQLLLDHEDENPYVFHQADDTIDAGKDDAKKPKNSDVKTNQGDSEKGSQNEASSSQRAPEQQGIASRDRDIDAGTNGTVTIPRVQAITKKMRLPKVKGKVVLNIQHLIDYSPDQDDLFNTRSSQEQFSYWYDNVKASYDLDDASMQVIMNGLMVWCLNNSTSPNLKGNWVMMDGEEQVEYPLQPVLEYAQPTFRMIMRHFSDAAEAYIVKENTKKPYMPRYGLIRNLRDYSCARYAFDFYEMNSKTPARAKEAHLQMKAAALRGAANEMFGLDGKVGETEERTERHTAADVNKNMHSLLGVRHG